MYIHTSICVYIYRERERFREYLVDACVTACWLHHACKRVIKLLSPISALNIMCYATQNALTGLNRLIPCSQVCSQHAMQHKSAKYLQVPMPTLVAKAVRPISGLRRARLTLGDWKGVAAASL